LAREQQQSEGSSSLMEPSTLFLEGLELDLVLNQISFKFSFYFVLGRIYVLAIFNEFFFSFSVKIDHSGKSSKCPKVVGSFGKRNCEN